MDGKSQAWRDAADKLLEALARENKYIVSDMVIIFLESASYGLDDYSPLGGVFKRAAARGIIHRIDRPTKQALWYSRIHNVAPENDPMQCVDCHRRTYRYEADQRNFNTGGCSECGGRLVVIGNVQE